MSNPKWSPEPWRVHDLDRRCVVGSDDLVIADIRSWRGHPGDAPLIGTAPALYRELESLVRRVRQAADGGDPASVIDTTEAEDLLAKARGETP